MNKKIQNKICEIKNKEYLCNPVPTEERDFSRKLLNFFTLIIDKTERKKVQQVPRTKKFESVNFLIEGIRSVRASLGK